MQKLPGRGGGGCVRAWPPRSGGGGSLVSLGPTSWLLTPTSVFTSCLGGGMCCDLPISPAPGWEGPSISASPTAVGTCDSSPPPPNNSPFLTEGTAGPQMALLAYVILGESFQGSKAVGVSPDLTWKGGGLEPQGFAHSEQPDFLLAETCLQWLPKLGGWGRAASNMVEKPPLPLSCKKCSHLDCPEALG